MGEQLLHNAYWAAKEYIINQQGQSSYTGLGYGIDRWVVEQNATLQIMDDCISIDASYSSGILQKLDYGTLPTSLTFSVLVKEGVGGIFISNHPVQMIDGPGLYSITFSEIINPATDYAYIRAWDNKNLKLKAAKLELGPVQTLAHKEGDTWVLNDPPPDPALELLKCKKYLQPMMFSAWSCVDKHISTKGEFLLTFESRMFPVQMRANPIIINPDDIWISNQSYNTWYKPLSVNSCCTKYTCLLSVALEEEIYNSRDKFFLWSGKIAGVGSPILFSADL